MLPPNAKSCINYCNYLFNCRNILKANLEETEGIQLAHSNEKDTLNAKFTKERNQLEETIDQLRAAFEVKYSCFPWWQGGRLHKVLQIFLYLNSSTRCARFFKFPTNFAINFSIILEIPSGFCIPSFLDNFAQALDIF